MNAVALTVGQPVVILAGLPYSMTFSEIDTLEGQEGIIVAIDDDASEEEEPVPYQVQLTAGGEPVWAQAVRLVVDPARALDVAAEAARHLAERTAALAIEFQNYSLAVRGRLTAIQEFVDGGNMPDSVHAELKEILAQD